MYIHTSTYAHPETYGKKTYCNEKCPITPMQEKLKTLILI